MKTYTIPVSWTMIGVVEVEAESLNKAIKIAQNDDGIIPIPDNGQYVGDSWKVECVDTNYLRQYCNDEQCDKEEK